MSLRNSILTGVLLLAGAVPAFAQDVTSVTRPEGTLGDVLVIAGTQLGDKGNPKVFLSLAAPVLVKARPKAKTPKIKLKVLAASDTEITVEIRNVSKKAPVGLYDLHIKPKGGSEFVTDNAFQLRAPQVLAVDPMTAAPGDTVNVSVQDYGSRGKHSASVGSTVARIVSETELTDGLWTIAIQVPLVPNGTWPVCIENQLGVGVLKAALDVTGSASTAADVSTSIEISGSKAFRAKLKDVAIDEQSGPETNIGGTDGSKGRPRVLGISMDTTIADLAIGDSFAGSSGLIQFSLTKKRGTAVVTTWSTTSNRTGETFSIDVLSRDDECVVLFVCGTLRIGLGNGAERIDVLGTLKSPIDPAPDEPSKDCDPLTTATGSITGGFVSVAQKNIGLATVAGPGSFKFASATQDNSQSVPEQALSFTVSQFDPNSTPLPATFDSISLSGTGLTEFTLQLADNTFFSQIINGATLGSSMSVTITKVEKVKKNKDGILACIHGSFTGTLGKNDAQRTPQTFNGTFEIPWYDLGFGQ